MAAVGYLCLIPVFRGVANLDSTHAAACLVENVALTGVFLLPPILRPEQAGERELLLARPLGPIIYLAVRLTIALILLTVLIGIFAGVMLVLGCSFPLVPYVGGTLTAALALGGVGLGIAALTDSTIVGYLVSIGYFLLPILGIVDRENRLSPLSVSAHLGTLQPVLLVIGCGGILLALLQEKKRRP